MAAGRAERINGGKVLKLNAEVGGKHSLVHHNTLQIDQLDHKRGGGFIVWEAGDGKIGKKGGLHINILHQALHAERIIGGKYCSQQLH